MVAVLFVAACSGSDSAIPDAVSVEDGSVVAGSVEDGSVEDGSVVAGSTPLDETGVAPEAFSTVLARVTEADGSTCEVCLWLADDASERGRGLMGVTDLGDAMGMAFRFDAPTDGAFYMFHTVTPLSIAWFAPDGALVAAADMAPCVETDAAECERFSPGAPYQLAIEVFEGDLESIGITAGATVELLADTEAQNCPLAVN